MPWIVAPNKRIYQRIGTQWRSTGKDECASDIAANADGVIYIIGCGGSDPAIKYFDFVTDSFIDLTSIKGDDGTKVKSTGKIVAVDPKGNPWMVQSNKHIFKRSED